MLFQVAGFQAFKGFDKNRLWHLKVFDLDVPVMSVVSQPSMRRSLDCCQ